MLMLEIADNPNCEPVDLRVFENLDAARRVTHVRLEREPGRPVWCEVVGWGADGAPRPARAQKVSDSGNGTALLVYGGEAGLRLRPEGAAAPWGLAQPAQWGAPFLLMDSAEDARLEPADG